MGGGASAEDILSVSEALEDDELAYLAPQAANWEWYPNSFLAERESNEPWLSSALRKVESVVQIALEAGFTREGIVIGGFSQGACLSTEIRRDAPCSLRRSDWLDRRADWAAGKRCVAHR